MEKLCDMPDEIIQKSIIGFQNEPPPQDLSLAVLDLIWPLKSKIHY